MTNIKYIIKKFNLENIGQISNEAMQMHFKLYEGYVNNVNIILEKLEILKANEPEWNELHRRLGWEFNGMRLHELFFESLMLNSFNVKGVGILPLGEGRVGILFSKIERDFGSFENWKTNFVNMCKIRGMGWSMLVQDNRTGKLINIWVNEHDVGMLADVKIILNIDMFEHAYIKDFGANRVPYIESVFAHINWDVVSERFNVV